MSKLKELGILTNNKIYSSRNNGTFKENFLDILKKRCDTYEIEEFIRNEKLDLELLNSIKTIDDIMLILNKSMGDLEPIKLSLSDKDNNVKGLKIDEDIQSAGTSIYGDQCSMNYSPLFVKQWANEYGNNKYLQDVLNGLFNMEESFGLDYYEGEELYLLEDLSIIPIKCKQLLFCGSDYYLINDKTPVKIYTGEIEDPGTFLWNILNIDSSQEEEDIIKKITK